MSQLMSTLQQNRELPCTLTVYGDLSSGILAAFLGIKDPFHEGDHPFHEGALPFLGMAQRFLGVEAAFLSGELALLGSVHPLLAMELRLLGSEEAFHGMEPRSGEKLRPIHHINFANTKTLVQPLKRRF